MAFVCLPIASLKALDADSTKTDLLFDNISILGQGGEGEVSSTKGTMKMETKGYVWEAFNMDLNNDSNFATIAYTLSKPSDFMLGIRVDGMPVKFIENTSKDGLTRVESFPFPHTLPPGSYVVTLSLESSRHVPIAATVKSVSFSAIDPSLPKPEEEQASN